MEDIVKTPIPEGVVNVKEYRKMKLLEQHPTVRNTMYVTSEDEEINIGMLPHRLREKIAHLSPQEQDDIMELKRKYNQYRAKITTAKSLAFGTSGRNGGKTREQIYQLIPYEEDVVELLGRMFTTAEVVRIMGEENGIDTNEDDVREILKKRIVEIEKKREEFRNRLTDVRLYSKRPRLEELAWMYSKMKLQYIHLGKVDAYNSMLRTLEQIRKEAEGDIININGALDINIEVTIQNHIQKEILKTINLKEIILGRVSARMGFDPKKLVAGLHNSYYAKFVDISGDYDEDADMNYPSQSAYDFSAIERTAGREVMDVKAEVLDETSKSTASNVKDLFLSKVRRQKEEMERRQASFDNMADGKRPVANEEETPLDRTKYNGRGKDKILPSKTSAFKQNQAKSSKDYFTGLKKKKAKK